MQELPIAYDTGILSERVAATRRSVLVSAIMTGVSVLGFVGVVLYIQIGRNGNAGEMWEMLRWVLGFSAGFGVLGVAARVFWLMRQRAGLAQIGQGIALVVSNRGIETADGKFGWDDIGDVRAARGKLGHGYRLEVRHGAGSLTLPLEGLAILPGSLDAVTRAYSAGRHGVDLSVVDD